MKKIALLNVFIGDFPWFFDYFIKSCSYNPTIDFYVFCNKTYDKTIPENVSFVYLTLEQFNVLASSKLGLEVSIKNAYKLCDFKPAYGVIFSEYLAKYDFWGICDIDVVFGRIREFMTEIVLSEHDVISVRNDFPTGYFMLFKNERRINHLFTKSKDYKMIFSSPKHFCFDECNFKHNAVSAGYNILEIPCEIESMHHVLVKEQNNIRVFWDFLIVEGHPGNLKWDEGQLIYKKKYEVLLYHLKFFKSNVNVRKKRPNVLSKKFKIHKYHIQSQSVNIFKIFWCYFEYEIMIPFFHRLWQRINYFLALKLHPVTPPVTSQEIIFSDGNVFLKKHGEKLFVLAFNKGFKDQQLCVPSYFEKQVFYSKEKQYTRYIISEDTEHSITFETVNDIGIVFKFNLKSM